MSAIVWIYIAILLLVILVALIINEIDNNKTKNNSKMDFGNSIDLTGVPVVTFQNNFHKFNFLLDTGANLSVINSTELEKFVYTKSDRTTSIYGMEGKPQNVNFVKIGLDYKSYHFREDFQVVNMSSAFNKLKNNTGVYISGILGSEFLKEHKYVLDFKELIAYRRK